MISLNPMLFKNMAHVGSFKHFVFVYLRIFIFYILYKGMSYSISLNPMLFNGPFNFTFTLESEEFEKSEKVVLLRFGSLSDHDKH